MILNIQESTDGFVFYTDNDTDDGTYHHIAMCIATVYLSIFPPSFKLRRTNGYNYVLLEIYGKTEKLYSGFDVIPTKNSHKELTAEQYSEYLQQMNDLLSNEYHGEIHPDIWM